MKVENVDWRRGCPDQYEDSQNAFVQVGSRGAVFVAVYDRGSGEFWVGPNSLDHVYAWAPYDTRKIVAEVPPKDTGGES